MNIIEHLFQDFNRIAIKSSSVPKDILASSKSDTDI